jgi:hypothetical protein
MKPRPLMVLCPLCPVIGELTMNSKIAPPALRKMRQILFFKSEACFIGRACKCRIAPLRCKIAPHHVFTSVPGCKRDHFLIGLHS